MSTPTKENTKKTSDPVLQSSGEVLKEVVKEKLEEDFEEPTLQGIVNLLTMMNTKFDTKFDALENRMAIQEDRTAVLEARRTPPRSRAPSQESVKELKTEISVVEVSGRSSLIEDFLARRSGSWWRDFLFLNSHPVL